MQALLNLVFKILKWPVALVALLGLPGIAVECWHQVSGAFSAEHWPFWAGVSGVALLWMVWLRKARWARFLTTMEHEALHALIGFLSFIPIRELKVNEDGSGHVVFSPPTHWLMMLAPYFVPLTLAIYAAIVFALELDPGIEAAVLGAIFGLEWAGNLREIHPNQTDFRQAGWTFTLLFLPSAILLSYGTAITMLLEGGVAPGWSFAKSGATGMVQDSWTWLELGIQQLRDLLPE